MTEHEQLIRAEAVALQEPERMDCDVCIENDYNCREQCGDRCFEYDKWREEEL